MEGRGVVSIRLEIELTDAQLDVIVERLRERMAPTAPEERWLETKEAAERIGVHPVTLRKMAAERKIDYAQDGPGCKLFFSTLTLDRHRNGGVR